MRRLLLIDSSAHTRVMLSAVLRRLRYQVTPVETGGEAISWATADIHPAADAVVVVLRRSDPTIAGLCAFLHREWNLPVVTITAFADGEAPRCYADVELGKPFDAYQLADALERLIGRHSNTPEGPATENAAE